MPFAALLMDADIIILNQVSQTKKDKYLDIVYIQNIKNETNELIYKTESDTDLENKLMGKGGMEE